jgi:hypothetical protein
MIDRPMLLRMTKEEREIAELQAILSIADSLAAIKDEVLAMRGALSALSALSEQGEATGKKK